MFNKRILTPLLIILLLLSIVVYGAPTYVNVGPTTEFDGDIKIISEIVAEGVTANEFETTLKFTDPTADRIITIPDKDLILVGTVDKLSVFAATTSAELAGVISDEMGAGKLRFDTAVTAKTATATLTVAEAGTILVKSNIVIGTDIAFVDGGGGEDTITSVANAFGGYAVGDKITISGATNAGNNSTFTLTGAAAGTLTVATASLTVEAAGASVTIKNAYTLTLPTAVGNTGLTYHFIKTDANYNLITLDGDGTEKLNYENSTGAPVLTYARLNTYCAEVTVVSDGSNWQVISEALGQVPFVEVSLSATQTDMLNDAWTKIDYTEEAKDIGDNFSNGNWVTGTTTGTTVNHVIDSGGAFTAAMVGKRIKNTTDITYTYITAYTSATDVTVRDDIFVSGENYQILYARFTAPIPGIYYILNHVQFVNASVIADKAYAAGIYKNNGFMGNLFNQAAAIDYLIAAYSTYATLAIGDYLEGMVYSKSGVNTVDIEGGNAFYTHMYVRLISKG